MAGMGPPPKSPENRVRRHATIAMTSLPAEGRKGRLPKWPLIPDVVMSARRDLAEAKVEGLESDVAEGKPVERRLDQARERLEILNRQLAEQKTLEASLWRDLWKLPQAVEWARLGWMRDVAQYVRHKVLAELGDLDSAKEARQWSDRLGLTPLAMLRLRWKIATDEVAEKRQQKESTSARGRIRAVG
ncbi:hypothetical protein ABGB07_03835 [Micromonosporaceae bacterium B7E4]